MKSYSAFNFFRLYSIPQLAAHVNVPNLQVGAAHLYVAIHGFKIRFGWRHSHVIYAEGRQIDLTYKRVI